MRLTKQDWSELAVPTQLRFHAAAAKYGITTYRLHQLVNTGALTQLRIGHGKFRHLLTDELDYLTTLSDCEESERIELMKHFRRDKGRLAK